MLFIIRSCRRIPVPCSEAYNASLYFPLSQAIFLGFCLMITLLVLSSGPVYAAWMLTSGNDEAGLKVYIDPDSIRRNGDLAKMWQLLDYKTVQTVAGDSLLSMKRFSEYDCATKRTRMLGYTWFSGNMGGGKVVFSAPEVQQWEPVVPRSINQTLWKAACGIK
jgi:surface-adhesin protein E